MASLTFLTCKFRGKSDCNSNGAEQRRNISSMKKLLLTKAAPLAGLLLFAGCVTYQEPPQDVTSEPPAPQVEVIPPQPDVTFVWTPGYWDWRGRWVWVHGWWGS